MASRPALRWRIFLGIFCFAMGLALYDGWVVTRFRHRAAEAQQPANTFKEVDRLDVFGPKAPTPLDQGVAELNEKLAERRGRVKQGGEMSPAEKQALRPITVEEVVAAIRNWNPRANPISPITDEEFRLIQKIATDRVLPPRSKLDFNDIWTPENRQDKQAHHFVRIMLDVMVEKDHGYSVPILSEEVGRRPWHVPPPGYSWSTPPQPMEPRFGGLSTFTSDLIARYDENETDALVYHVKHDYDVIDVEIVAFDENNDAFDLDRQPLGAYDKFITARFRLDPARLAKDKVRYVGVEAVRRSDLERLANRARQWQESHRVDSLPLPEIGRPYAFSLRVGGPPIESSQWRGKVVLVDFWSSSCVPCLKEMPALKQLYAHWHERGLEVVGISFDTDPQQAQAVIDRMQFPWPSAAIGEDTPVERLWHSRDQITELPTVLLVDKAGILRYELPGDVAAVEEKLKELLDESVPKAAAKAPQ